MKEHRPSTKAIALAAGAAMLVAAACPALAKSSKASGGAAAAKLTGSASKEKPVRVVPKLFVVHPQIVP